MRVLGIDYGKKKTGLALGNSETKIASPLFVIVGGEAGLDEIKKIVNEEEIEKIIIGLPTVTAEGQISDHRESTEQFIELVRSKFDLSVETVNEQFTSKEGRRLQIEEGASAPEDALAAMLILQDYFS